MKSPRIVIRTQAAGDGSFYADLLFQPARALKADRYDVQLKFGDGQTVSFEIKGAAFDPGLRVAPIRQGLKA